MIRSGTSCHLIVNAKEKEKLTFSGIKVTKEGFFFGFLIIMNEGRVSFVCRRTCKSLIKIHICIFFDTVLCLH